MPDPLETLLAGARHLNVPLNEAQAAKLLRLSAELISWNQDFNLTALDEPAQVLTHHLLDSLSIYPDLAGQRIADVGTGAGFPGLPLAVVTPNSTFTLIDATLKKLRFVTHAAELLDLGNVTTVHKRVEDMKGVPAFSTVVTRAFAPLPRLLRWVRPVCDRETRVVAMKGRWPPAEGADDAAELPREWRIESTRRISVPGLDAERHVITLRLAVPT